MVWFNLVLVMLLSHFFYQSSAFTILMNKPVNTVTSHSDNEDIAQCRQTVYELLPQELVEKGKFHACGRLDVKTSGLLILTTDTKLVHYVTHPQEDASSKLWKYYEALGMGHIEESDIQRLREGVDLQGSLGISHPARVELLSYSTEGKKKTKLKIGIAQGKNRQIRRMLHSIGSGVMELCRVQISRGNRGTVSFKRILLSIVVVLFNVRVVP